MSDRNVAGVFVSYIDSKNDIISVLVAILFYSDNKELIIKNIKKIAANVNIYMEIAIDNDYCVTMNDFHLFKRPLDEFEIMNKILRLL